MVKLYRTSAALSLAAIVLLPATAFADGRERKHHGYSSVPEINGANAGIALALVAGGAAVVLGRRRRKQT